MQITSFFETFRRRRLPLVIVLLVGLCVGAAAWMTTKVSYNANAVAVVVPPAVPGQPTTGNPLSRVSFDSTAIASLAVTVMESPEVATAVGRDAGGSIVSVDNRLEATSPAPTYSVRLNVTAEGSTPEQAKKSAHAAIAATGDQFAAFQRDQLGVEPRYTATMKELVPPYASTSNRTSKLRATAGSALGVIVLGVVLVLLWDAVGARRARLAIGEAARHRQPGEEP